jgi:Protein of unknown function (DUF2914)/Tetratricopeptide repeat
MAEPDRVQTVVDAAERAAAEKDFAAAERLLREAVGLQEADLGPHHPDLANTLNNLGVVCEMADQPSEAETCYRRAYAIAAAALPPDHPFVTTSRENLTEFCKARGKPIDLPLPARAVPSAEPVEQEPPELAPVVEKPPSVVEKPPVVMPPRAETPVRVLPRISSRLAIAIVAVIVLLLVIIVLTRSADRDSPTNAETSPQERLAPPEPSASPATPSPGASVADPKASSSQAVPPSRPDGDKPQRGASANPGAAPPRSMVASALLCQRFTPRGAPDWDCEQARGPLDRSTLVFYTRIKSVRPTTVQHRWYRGNELHQSVRLDVRANQVDGYRTYSRYTVKTPGAWRVELRTMDGALLHEERFDVR